MTGEAVDTSWLDGPAPKVGADSPTTNGDSEESWLEIGDPNAGKTTAAFRGLIEACMRGTDRVMACNGQYLAYRPFNREFDKETNPRTRERFQMFLEKGLYRHVGTYDEVQIYELLEGNPFRHVEKSYVIGQNYWADIRQAAQAAYNRRWSDYHDLLNAMAIAIKSGRDPIFAKAMWDDTVAHVTVAISQMAGAPTEREINEGFMSIRRARGLSSGTPIVTLNSNSLQKVAFEGRS